jgi:uncharacterized short protein YbdD (DUF466 family)
MGYIVKDESIFNLTITDEDYEAYIQKNKNNYPQNTRLRPADEDFFDALASYDMADTPEGRELLDALSKLD